ncbi:MAG: phospholipase A [Planctomycetes bacterium]|nr:phospholipase A [Planctomycetota bacterium]
MNRRVRRIVAGLTLGATLACHAPSPLEPRLDGDASPLGASGPGFAGDAAAAERARSLLTRHFDLDRRDVVLKLKPHHDSFFTGRYTDHINDASNPSAPHEFEHGELEFQFSFKSRMPFFRGPGLPDLWIAYTQHSFWQLGQPSGPIRETNYEPEGFLLWPLGAAGEWGDVQLVVAGIGVSHQSNGRGDDESRAWNRVIGQLGFEFGDDTTLYVRPWWRIPESSRNDGNPDIVDYLGHGDLRASHRFVCFDREITAGALLRSNLDGSPSRGAVQLSLAGPFFHPKLYWYVQGFTGFGESLIDYDHRQKSVAVGITLRDWE